MSRGAVAFARRKPDSGPWTGYSSVTRIRRPLHGRPDPYSSR
jgi:hypothetical protein